MVNLKYSIKRIRKLLSSFRWTYFRLSGKIRLSMAFDITISSDTGMPLNIRVPQKYIQHMGDHAHHASASIMQAILRSQAAAHTKGPEAHARQREVSS